MSKNLVLDMFVRLHKTGGVTMSEGEGERVVVRVGLRVQVEVGVRVKVEGGGWGEGDVEM